MSIEDLGNYSSITSLVITIFVGLGTFLVNKRLKSLKHKLLTKETLPHLIEDLKKNKSSIHNLVSSYDDSFSELKHQIAHSTVILKNIDSKLPKENSLELKKIIKKSKVISKSKFIKIDNIKSPKKFYELWKQKEVDKDDIWNFYTLLSTSQTEIEYLYKEYVKFN